MDKRQIIEKIKQDVCQWFSIHWFIYHPHYFHHVKSGVTGKIPASFFGTEVDDDEHSGAMLATPLILWRTSSDSWTGKEKAKLRATATEFKIKFHIVVRQ